MKALIFSILTISFGLNSCRQENSFDKVRSVILMSDKLDVNSTFCNSDPVEYGTGKTMDKYIRGNCDSEFFKYFEDLRVKDTTVIAKILMVNLCKLRRTFNRPIRTVTNDQMIAILKASLDETIRNEKGIDSYFSPKPK
ncbi:MAG: hypothetical protein ACI865_002535 [Flavobacteriaceae bacterium]|jgi:hypothetical protein